jgi:hypothetical protein
MKEYGGMDKYIHIFFISALAGGEWLASRPGFLPQGNPSLLPEPVWTTWRTEKSYPCRDSKSELSDVQPIASS